jgi:hypothetical protein
VLDDSRISAKAREPPSVRIKHNAINTNAAIDPLTREFARLESAHALGPLVESILFTDIFLLPRHMENRRDCWVFPAAQNPNQEKDDAERDCEKDKSATVVQSAS